MQPSKLDISNKDFWVSNNNRDEISDTGGGGCFFFLYLLRSELEIAKEETFNSNAALAHTGESGYLKQELGLRRTFEKLKSGMDLREKEVVDDHWKFNQTRQREFN